MMSYNLQCWKREAGTGGQLGCTRTLPLRCVRKLDYQAAGRQEEEGSDNWFYTHHLYIGVSLVHSGQHRTWLSTAVTFTATLETILFTAGAHHHHQQWP